MPPQINIYISYVFFFNDTATTEIYTLSLHDALPISITKIEVVPKIIKAGKEIILKASIKEKTVPSYQSQGSCYDSIMPCSLNEAECNSHPRCTWSEGGGRCSGSKQDSCNDLTVDDCGGWNSGISGCDWTDEEGGCFFNENHPACWSFEGDYEACVNIDYCYFDFFCDPKEYLGCWYDKQEDCENVNYCEWNEEWGGYCMEKNCWSNHNNKGDCDNDEACIWYGSENSGWCDNIINKCYNYDNYEDCSTDLDCYSDPINSYCNFKWESYKEDCSYYWEDPELCAAKGCSWQSSFCTGEVYCGQLDCGQYIYDEDGTRCEANGCIWGGKYNCYPTASKCEEYADFGCGIKEKGCYKSEYFDISECYDFKNEQADCEAAGCIYCSDASGCEI